MTGYSIRLAENPAVSTASDGVMDLTDKFNSWRHSTRFIGGNWIGEGTADLRQASSERGMTEAEMRDFFNAGLGKRIVVAHGGRDYWEGQVVRITYLHRGQQFVRSMEEMANRVKIIYTRLGPNLLQNGDVEGGAWGSVGTPSTIETTTDWFAKGTTAMHCVTDAAGEGMEIEYSGAGTTWEIAASTAYICSVIVNVVSGTWTLTVYQSDGTTVLAQRSTVSSGRQWLQCTIPETNTYGGGGTDYIYVHLTANDAAEECYADGALFRVAPYRAETKWFEDTDSIAQYGQKEGIYLEGEKTDDEADAMAERELAEWAWSQTLGGRGGRTFEAERARPDRLTVTCQGMVWTLNWRYALTDDTGEAATHVASLLDESEFIASADALIAANTTEVFIESGNPRPLWRQLEKILKVGDGSGNPWIGGVYPGLRFRYEARPTTLNYIFTRGELLGFDWGPVHPIEAVPGYILLADMPVIDPIAGGAAVDDARWQLATEMWFVDDGRALRNEWSWEPIK